MIVLDQLPLLIAVVFGQQSSAERHPLFTLNWLSPFVGGALALLSIVAQGRGHKLEEHPAEPFNGPGDFIRRILREQFITFPRFVLSGQWRQQFRAARR